MGDALDRAAELAEFLAELAAATGDARTARAATAALGVAECIHAAAESLAEFAGVAQ